MVTSKQFNICRQVKSFSPTLSLLSDTKYIGTHVVWGLNLGKNNITAAFLAATSLVKAFTLPAVKGAGIVLDGIELGNEPDLYANNGARDSNYDSQTYVKE